ncbi:hypothetical protein CPB84DRAFT_1310391 [Gymnopilus junonius]|uniref:Uncharacterized protein n=1 Tax=Gymnopilus junonius TaxID=109634 RepID=A0A9P5TLJ0_GYMJU|nr:hypothetical protein CPB84DRAFT_1310391 [Gymnopilus junonius]
MLAFGGNSTNLFRGAFMQSGSPIPIGNLTGGQVFFQIYLRTSDPQALESNIMTNLPTRRIVMDLMILWLASEMCHMPS